MRRMIRTYTIGLVALFTIAATGRSATIEIERIRDDKATLVPETGETYFSVVVDVNALASDRYSFGLSLGKAHAHSATNLPVGRHEITIPCYSRNLAQLSAPVSNVTVTIHSPPSARPAMLTFQTSKSHALRRSYTPDEFKRRPARIADATQSYKVIADSLAETTLLTQHRPRDQRFTNTVQPADLGKLFGRPCTSRAYRLFFALPPETTAYIAVSESRDSAFVIEDLDSFNRFAATLSPAPAGVSQWIAHAKALMSILHIASDPTVLAEIPKAKRVRSGRSKVMSLGQWFKKNKSSTSFHAPEFTRTEEAQKLRFFSWQGLVGIIRHHEYRMKPNGEIISHRDEKLATWVGDWWIH